MYIGSYNSFIIMSFSMYIHELKDWPNFYWNEEAITKLLIPLRYQQGLLIGKLENVGFDLRSEAVLQTLTQDVIKTSEIENEIFDQYYC
jgi:Fic family protein